MLQPQLPYVVFKIKSYRYCTQTYSSVEIADRRSASGLGHQENRFRSTKRTKNNCYGLIAFWFIPMCTWEAKSYLIRLYSTFLFEGLELWNLAPWQRSSVDIEIFPDFFWSEARGSRHSRTKCQKRPFFAFFRPTLAAKSITQKKIIFSLRGT